MENCLTLLFRMYYCPWIIEFVPRLVLIDHFIVNMTTDVFSVKTLATHVLTYVNDRIIGSDKLFKIRRKLRMLYYVVIVVIVYI